MPSPPPPTHPWQCLIPEVPFRLTGETGVFAYLEKVLSDKGHAVMCVAEGAGQVRGAVCAGRAGRAGSDAGGSRAVSRGMAAGIHDGRAVLLSQYWLVAVLDAHSTSHSSSPLFVQDILAAGDGNLKTDASGNPILEDVGPWLKSEMKKYFKDADVKYIGALMG